MPAFENLLFHGGRLRLRLAEPAPWRAAARNLAVGWGPQGVCVNAVSPGLVRTLLAGDLLADGAFMQRRLAMTPLRRVGEPEEVAGVVAMLAGRAGGFVTGQNIAVDGGTLVSDGS